MWSQSWVDGYRHGQGLTIDTARQIEVRLMARLLYLGFIHVAMAGALIAFAMLMTHVSHVLDVWGYAVTQGMYQWQWQPLTQAAFGTLVSLWILGKLLHWAVHALKRTWHEEPAWIDNERSRQLVAAMAAWASFGIVLSILPVALGTQQFVINSALVVILALTAIVTKWSVPIAMAHVSQQARLQDFSTAYMLALMAGACGLDAVDPPRPVQDELKVSP